MAEETLVSAARRAVRFFNIDQVGHGGLTSIETLWAMQILEGEVAKTDAAVATVFPPPPDPDDGAAPL